MNSSITPTKEIVESSAKLQKILFNRLQDSMPRTQPRMSFFDSLKHSNQDTIKRRIESKRHPMTGMSGPRSQSSNRTIFSRDNVRPSYKLNPRILETWLNSTVSDAEDLNVPSSVLKSESRLPLVRFGIDRSSLLNSGLPSIEIDRLYQSLFVHSIGFYELILKVLEHTNKKYSIVTSIWKVFAILLEYCCKLDYEMIITTLNLEKREELDQLENEYKGQISLMEEHAKRLIDNMNVVRTQLRDVQKDLQREIEKREELEDELMQRGSGHEEEVALRLQFESKLNQMYAKQRDLSTRLEQLNEMVQDQQRLIDAKSDQVSKEKKRANDLIQGKIEAEQEMKKMEEKYTQLETINANLENRLDASTKKIEDLNSHISRLQSSLSECLNEISQKKISIDDHKFEIDICKVQIQKLENVISEFASEKKLLNERIVELQNTYSEEHEKNKYFEQEYTIIKESEAVFKTGFEKYRIKVEELSNLSEKLERDRDRLKVALDSSVYMENEMKDQVKRSQEKIEEMNKGRRVVEELNEHLKQKLDEKIDDLKLARQHVVELKGELENVKNSETELNGEITTLTIKIKSIERQFETTKETLQEKINNLNDILTSEKRIRENWIYRYEEEQRTHSLTTKNLIAAEDRVNDLTMKTNSLTAALEEKSASLEKSLTKNRDLFEEILNLRSLEEEFSRKNKTLNVIMNSIEKENREKLGEIFTDIEEMKADHSRDIERKSIEIEEVWIQALRNLEKLKVTSDELEGLKGKFVEKSDLLDKANEKIQFQSLAVEQNSMVIEDMSREIEAKLDFIENQAKEFEDLRLKHYDLNKQMNEWLNKVPRYLKREKNPFVVLEDKIKDLESEIKKIMLNKENVDDKETQFKFEIETGDFNGQTEAETDSFHRRTARSKELAEKSVQVNIIEVPRASLAPTVDSGKENLNKRYSQDDPIKIPSKGHLRQQSADSIHREEEPSTPVNLRSIYKHSEDYEEEKIDSMRLPSLSKKLGSIRPPTVPSILTSEIKRHIRQANSRRKNEGIF